MAGGDTDVQSNMYATIAKSHGGTIRSMALRYVPNPERGFSPGSQREFSTGSQRGPDSYREGPRGGPRVPGVKTPRPALSQMLEEGEFSGCTFQPGGPQPPLLPSPHPCYGRRTYIANVQIGYRPLYSLYINLYNFFRIML